jgi:hypothetical protein
MTRTTTRPDGRTRRRTLALAALVLLGAAAIGTAAAASDRPAVRVDDVAVATGDTAVVAVVLTAAPDGLAGYYLRVAVADADVARVAGASYPDAFGLTTDPEVGADGRTVALEAADLDGAIEPGATDVTLATVELAGRAPGEVRVAVDPVQFDADGGESFDPVARPGTVAVTDGEGTASRSPDDTDTTGTTATATGRADDGTVAPATAASGDLPTTLAVFALGAFLALVGLVARRR